MPTTINYVDRQAFGILVPFLQKSIGWNEARYGYIVTAFQGAYALGLLLVGRSIDRVGTRMTRQYQAIFIVAGSAYLLALLVIHVLAPRLEPAAVELSQEE